MEEQSKNQEYPEGYRCWKCQGGPQCGYCRKHNPWYHLARWALAIVIIIVVFWFGLSLGKLEGELGVLGGQAMMYHSGSYSHAYPATQDMGSHWQAARTASSSASNQ